MKYIGLVFSLAVVAFARPDVSHLSGYNYKPPATSYGVPLHSVGQVYSQNTHYYQNKPTQNYLPPTLQLPSTQGHSSFLSGHFGAHNQEVRDEKRVYYFAAPEVKERSKLRINIVPQHQKNTNVIFVKAPNYEAPIPEVVIPPTHIEDKTKVVVLVKKPEQPDQVVVAAPPAIKADKPEVFVVNYANKHDAEHAVSGVSTGNSVGTGVHLVNDRPSFINTLHSDSLNGNVNSYGVRYASGNTGSLGNTYTIQAAGLQNAEGVSNLFETGTGGLHIRDGGNTGFSQSTLEVDSGSKGIDIPLGALEIHSDGEDNQGFIKSSEVQKTVEISKGSGGLVGGSGIQGTDAILASLGVSGHEQSHAIIGGTSHIGGSGSTGAILRAIDITSGNSGSGYSSSIDPTRNIVGPSSNIEIITKAELAKSRR